MARQLCGMILKGVASRQNSTVRQIMAPGYVRSLLVYSTFVGNDSDTHDDFLPKDNKTTSGLSIQDIVKQDIKENPVMLYMKGLPDAPRCGFSALAVKVLQQYGVPISARNILENAELKESVKAFTNWPTFPQIFVNGEFVGGSDIILKMHQDGELKALLSDIKTVQ